MLNRTVEIGQHRPPSAFWQLSQESSFPEEKWAQGFGQAEDDSTVRQVLAHMLLKPFGPLEDLALVTRGAEETAFT